MITAVKLNNTTINHKDGLIYLDNLNETLDSGIIVCESIDRLNINPFDKVEITYPDSSVKSFAVSDYIEEVASYEPRKYNYQIQYASPTIFFERVTLPNIAITKVFKEYNNENYLVKDGNFYCRSVGYYIRQYVKEYYPYDNYYFSSSLLEKADATICPEMTFNRPNLREVLQALFDVLDLIFVYKRYDDNHYIISYISPNIKNNAIDTSKLNTDTIRNSVNTYASNLDIELQNAISNETTTTTSFVTVRSDEGILTTDNAKIILSNPIYAIKNVAVNITAIPTTDDASWTDSGRPANISWINITRHVVEQSVYEGLEAKSAEWGEGISKPELTKYNTLYFKQGSNTIEGLGMTHKYLGILTSEPVIKDVLRYALGKDMSYEMGSALSDFVDNYFFEMMFKIEYETMQDVRVQTERTNALPHQSTLFDSQESSYVNTERFIKNSISKLNRMSNNERTITAIYTDFSDIPVLADYIDDYILTNREISIYDNYIAFKGILTKDYSNIYQFNAIDSRKRFYEIATEDTLVRHELLKYYIEFSYEENTLDEMETFSNKFIRQIGLKPGIALIKHYFLKDENNDGIYYPTRYIALDVVTNKTDNSVLFTFGFNDNIVGGNRVGSEKTGGYYMQPIKYVNDLGENQEVEIKFYSGTYNNIFDSGDEYTDFWSNYAKNYPRILDEDVDELFKNNVFTIESKHHKDQREIQKWSIQFNLLEDNNDIILSSYFKAENPLFNTLGHYSFSGLNVYQIDDKITKTNIDNIDLSKATLVGDDKITIYTNFFSILTSGNLVLATDSGNIVMGLNKYLASTPVYCNVRNTR